MRNHIRGCFLIQTISSTHSFNAFFDALWLLNIGSTFLLLIYCNVFAVEFNPYFDDITVTTLLFFHLTKAILELSLIAASADPLFSFSISFIGFSGAFSTLIKLYLLQQSLSLSTKVVIADLQRSYQL